MLESRRHHIIIPLFAESSPHPPCGDPVPRNIIHVIETRCPALATHPDLPNGHGWPSTSIHLPSLVDWDGFSAINVKCHSLWHCISQQRLIFSSSFNRSFLLYTYTHYTLTHNAFQHDEVSCSYRRSEATFEGSNAQEAGLGLG